MMLRHLPVKGVRDSGLYYPKLNKEIDGPLRIRGCAKRLSPILQPRSLQKKLSKK